MRSPSVQAPAEVGARKGPAGTILAAILLLAAISARPAGLGREAAIQVESRPPRVAFEEGEPLSLTIPAIELQAGLGLARLRQGQLDASMLKQSPVLITPAARPTLCRIGDMGVSLILGHRQWKQKALVFARLNELIEGDTIVVTGQGQSMTFEVYRKATIKPAEIWAVVDEEYSQCVKGKRPVIILVTCSPYGFNWRRLLIFAALRDA